MKLADDIADQVSLAAGTLGVYNVFAGGTEHLGEASTASSAVSTMDTLMARSRIRTILKRSPRRCDTAMAPTRMATVPRRCTFTAKAT